MAQGHHIYDPVRGLSDTTGQNGGRAVKEDIIVFIGLLRAAYKLRKSTMVYDRILHFESTSRP